MNQHASDPIAPLIQTLHNEGRLRVWSLVITVFGDLVQYRGGAVSTARLGQLLGRVGVEQGALRTALSRLGRDGWVTSERSGRTSIYRLSAQGVARFAPATSRIYAPPTIGETTRWTLSIRLDGASGQTVELQPAGQPVSGADLQLSGTLEHVSDAYRAGLLADAHRSALGVLSDDLAALAGAKIETPLEAAAARMLLIHRWRRIVLRHDDIAPGLMPDDAPLPDPRGAVAAAYRRLSPATEMWLGTALGDIAPMPVADATFAARFGGVQQA